MKYILLCLAVLASVLPVSAQNPGPIYPTNTIPSGACSQNVGYLYTPTGVLYTCQNGTWAALSGGSGSGNNTYCADATGSTTTYTCPVPTPTITTLTGLIVTFVPQTTNTGTSTLNVAALGEKTLKQADCSTNVASGALVGGTAYLFSYNGTSLCQASASVSGTLSQVITQTASDTLLTTGIWTVQLGSACGNLTTFSGSSLTATLSSAIPLAGACPLAIQNLAASDLTVARNGLLLNGGTTNLTLKQYQLVVLYSNGSTGWNYGPPITAGTNVTLTFSVAGIAVNATTASTTCTAPQVVTAIAAGGAATCTLLSDVTITTGTTATLSTAYTYNQEATAATAVAYTLPTASKGAQYCIGNSYNGSAATTGVLTLATSAAGQFIIFTDGTLSATGGNVTSAGAASDASCVVGLDATHWQLYVQSGTWTKH